MASPTATLRGLRALLRDGHFDKGLALAEACPEPGKRRVWLGAVLAEAVAAHEEAIAYRALERGASLSGFMGSVSVLTLAVLQAMDPLAERLIEAGADVNAQYPERVKTARNRTALMCATERAHTPLMRRLLERGADPRAHTSSNLSVPECALASPEPIAAIQVLLEHGLRPSELIGEEAPFFVFSKVAERPELVEAIRAWGHRQALAPRTGAGRADTLRSQTDSPQL